MCPVCGSKNLSEHYHDGVASYTCDQGHVFEVKKKAGYFHGGNTGSNPVGDAKPFQQLTVSPPP
jgi:hypothetical protein